MGFMLLPIFVAVFWIGMSAQSFGLSQSASGAGVPGQMKSAALVRGQQAAAYGQACVSAALALPGVISANLPVVMPAGVVMPTGAFCMTTPQGAGRNIYAVLPLGTPGMAAQTYGLTQYNAAWWRVLQAGVGTNMSTGGAQSFPASIPSPSLVDWVQSAS